MNDLNNYWPVSNLCLIAKIMEKHVLSLVSSYLNSHNVDNTLQSAYRPGYNTETALLKVVNDLFLSLNKGNISVLALLDFSSAFDTIDHSIHVNRLHTDFGFTDAVLQWTHLPSSHLPVVHCASIYLIIVLLLLLYTQVFLRVQYFSPCILSLCLPILPRTQSYTIHLLLTYFYRFLHSQTKYPSYVILYSEA